MSRLDQVNSAMQRELSLALARQAIFPKALVTVISVVCTPDLRWANVRVSVLPEKYNGTVLTELRQKTGQLSESLRRRLVFKRLPKINWLIDSTASRASELDKVFKEIEESEQNEDKGNVKTNEMESIENQGPKKKDD